MKIKSLRELKTLSGKTIFLRVDFNVPLRNGKIQEDYRIRAGLETIEFLLAKGARLIIASHLGEPQGREIAFSLKPVAARLQTLLKKPVKFLTEFNGLKIKAALKSLKNGEVILLENLRFNKGEYENDPKFAATLAGLADIYVNDAFAVCHRDQASVSAIKKYLPAYAGLLLEKEVAALRRILQPKKPLVVVMGGAKIKTKAPLISKLYPVASHILVGGALANNFFKFQNLETGKSLVDEDSRRFVKKFFQGRKLAAKIVLPRDVVVKNKQGRAQVVAPAEVAAGDTILDIGPKTIADFAGYIKKANSLVWNGPLGKFEEKSFKHGTDAIAYLLASRSSGLAYGVVGGGETVEILNRLKMAEYIDWVSTAGGAMLAYLGGEKLPGLKKIVLD